MARFIALGGATTQANAGAPIGAGCPNREEGTAHPVAPLWRGDAARIFALDRWVILLTRIDIPDTLTPNAAAEALRLRDNITRTVQWLGGAHFTITPSDDTVDIGAAGIIGLGRFVARGIRLIWIDARLSSTHRLVHTGALTRLAATK